MVTAIKAADVSSTNLSIQIPTTDLRRVVSLLSKVADRRSSIPMLGNVLIRVGPDGATLAATDLNNAVVFQDPAWRGGYGGIAVPAKSLADIVAAMSGDSVTLARSGPLGLRVSCGDAEMTLLGANDRDFPRIPVLTDADVWTPCDGKTLAAALGRVAHSVCKDETRFHLNGIFVESTGTSVRLVTTDGHRLTRHDVAVTGPRTPGVIVTAKGASQIVQLVKAAPTGDCALSLTKTHLVFRCGGFTLATKLIDATFPPYEQVIPKNHTKCATVERKPLIAALKRAKKLCTETRGVRLDFASGKVTLTSDHPDTGTSSESIPATSLWLEEGGSGRLGINAGYLLDAIDEITDRYVSLDFDGELAPILVRGIDDAISCSVETARYLGVIMPMRI